MPKGCTAPAPLEINLTNFTATQERMMRKEWPPGRANRASFYMGMVAIFLFCGVLALGHPPAASGQVNNYSIGALSLGDPGGADFVTLGGAGLVLERLLVNSPQGGGETTGVMSYYMDVVNWPGYAPTDGWGSVDQPPSTVAQSLTNVHGDINEAGASSARTVNMKPRKAVHLRTSSLPTRAV